MPHYRIAFISIHILKSTHELILSLRFEAIDPSKDCGFKTERKQHRRSLEKYPHLNYQTFTIKSPQKYPQS